MPKRKKPSMHSIKNSSGIRIDTLEGALLDLYYYARHVLDQRYVSLGEKEIANRIIELTKAKVK